jgi:hypothetical protein
MLKLGKTRRAGVGPRKPDKSSKKPLFDPQLYTNTWVSTESPLKFFVQPNQKSVIQVKTGALNPDCMENVCPPFRNSGTMIERPLLLFDSMSNFTIC